MSRAHPAAAAASFSLFGVACGYVAASAYLTYRIEGSFEQIDYLFLLRNFDQLQQQAPRDFMVVVGIIAAFVLVPILLAASAALNEKLPRIGMTQWQTLRDIKRNGFLLNPGGGFVVGKLGEPSSRARFLVSTAFPHCMVIAPTGRGKTAGFVIPNLLTFKGSTVTLDVKGECFEETARHRKSIGDRVIRFAPGDFSGKPTHRFNPLQRIASLPDRDQQMLELRSLAGQLLQNDSPSVTGLFRGGVMIFVAAGMLAIERGRPTLGEMYRMVVQGGDKKVAYAQLATESKHAPTRLEWENLASLNVNTLTSYLSLLLTSGLELWANPAIDAVTAVSDFSFRDLRRKPHSIYLAVGLNKVRDMAPVIRLFFADLIAALHEKEPGPDERFRVMILLDEFNKLGNLPIVAESIETLRSHGGHLAIISQSIPGIDGIYGENTRMSLQANTAVKVYFTPSDPKTIEVLSSSVGMSTRRTLSKSRPLAWSPLKRQTLTEKNEEVPLLSPDAARTMDVDDVVLVLDAQAPIRARRIKWFEDRALRKIHAAQKGEHPYPSAQKAAVDQLTHRVSQLEGELAAVRERGPAPLPSGAVSPEIATLLIGLAQQLQAKQTDATKSTQPRAETAADSRSQPSEPAAKVVEASPPEPSPAVEVPPSPAKLTPSSRRARTKDAKPMTAVQLDGFVTEERAETVRSATMRVDELLGREQTQQPPARSAPTDDDAPDGSSGYADDPKLADPGMGREERSPLGSPLP